MLLAVSQELGIKNEIIPRIASGFGGGMGGTGAVCGAVVGGIMAIPAQAKGMPPAWGAYVTVNNVDALIPQVKKLGGSICVPPMDIPGLGRFMVIQDPQGATLSLITYI